MTTDDATARDIVARYFAGPDERVLGVQAADETMLVATDRGAWTVESYRDPATGVGEGPYRVYDVRYDVFADPPPRPRGAAALSDGRTFHLSDREGMKAFYLAAREALTPLAIAALVGRYQGDDAADQHQNLVMERADLERLLSPGQIDAIPGLAKPRWTGNPGRGLRLDFYTYFIAPEPPDRMFRVGVNRWAVEEDPAGEVRWQVETVARGLESHRYSRH